MQVTDPVCSMTIESDKAAATEVFQGRTYYFCSASCHDTFRETPDRYAKKERGGGGGSHDSHGH